MSPGADHQYHAEPGDQVPRSFGELPTVHVRETEIGQEALHTVWGQLQERQGVGGGRAGCRRVPEIPNGAGRGRNSGVP